jgi:hypothetical protein
MSNAHNSLQLDSLRNWVNIWLALVIGSFLGSSLVPAILEKARTEGPWSEAIGYAGQVLLYNWLPTVLVFSLIAVVILFPLWRKGVVK